MLFWVSDYTAHVKYPCWDYVTAKRWYIYLTEYKNHDCELWSW